jgi:hypothetical protein
MISAATDADFKLADQFFNHGYRCIIFESAVLPKCDAEATVFYENRKNNSAEDS